jgi:fructose-1,6-bisphosphatase/inositol monophosphatase family enzyme
MLMTVPQRSSFDDVDAVLGVFNTAADVVADVLGRTSDWGPSGQRDSQYAFDVTADDACLKVLYDAGFAVFSEESGITGDAAAPLVVVDPVDGSTNASRGVPWFATALCLLNEGQPKVSLVANHATGQRWTAVAGGGAFLNGERIQQSGCTTLRSAVVAMSGLPRHHYGWGQFRVLGASAPDLCLVASGVLDAWCDMHRGGHGLWDYAASALVCMEVGAVVGDVFGRDLFTSDPTDRRSPIAAATQELFDAFLDERLKDG